MNPHDALTLARRFAELPQNRRRLFLEGLREEGIDFSLFPIPSGVDADARQELSYAQRRMWFLWRLEPGSAAYNLPSAVRLTGSFNEAAFRGAFDNLIERHETLRTVFPYESGVGARQAPLTEPLRIHHSDLQGTPRKDQEERVQALFEQHALEPFDLARGPLLRIHLVKLADDEHVLLLCLHHIVSDGWSMNVLIDEFTRYYRAYDEGCTPELAPLPIQYADYASWQRRWMEAGERERQVDYWRSTLGDEHPVLEIQGDRPRPATPSYRGARLEFVVEPELVVSLRALARQHQLTLFTVLLSGFDILLHRYSGQSDIRVGIPIANRHREDVEGLIGCLVNTQVIRAQVDGDTRVEELLLRLKEAVLAAQAHQDLPFEQLVEALQPERSLNHNPLFQVMYNHQPRVADVDGLRIGRDLVLSPIKRRTHTTQFDLSLDTWEQGGQLHAAFSYAADLFDAETVARIAEHWRTLLRGMATNASRRVGELPMLGDTELQQQLVAWNRTQAEYPKTQCVHAVIEAQAAKTPDAVALVFGDEQLTYRALNAKANQLAHTLMRLGVGPDVRVGIALERGPSLVVGLLGILKAGGAYVPLDPEYPEERIAYMLKDSGARLLLTQSELLSTLPVPEDVQTLCLDHPDSYAASASNLERSVQPENLAYVIYTSGSTGRPKGVMVRHDSLSNFMASMKKSLGVTASDRLLSVTTFSFDIFALELYLPLMHGAVVVLASQSQHSDPDALLDLIESRKISVMQATPSRWRMLLQSSRAAVLAGCKCWCGGEALSRDLALQVLEVGAQLVNLYGPTETTIWSALHGIDREGHPFVGRPIDNTSLYVASDRLSPLPIGAAGELLIGGVGLARGYHERAGLTAERFIPDPFSQDGSRLYRTGDLARYRADGVVEYVGRIDDQVKIRGFRIELGEIEARLQQCAEVREAAVVAQDGPSGKQLVGYVVLRDANVEHAALREELTVQLKVALPDYMVPAQLIVLEKLPLTPNGKLNRKALPKPDASALQKTYVEPRTAIQKQIASIWAEVLKLERVGLEDNFFELGGDSIVSIQVVSRAREAGVRFTPKDLFQHQTVQGLATVAEFGVDGVAIDQGPVDGELSLLPIQRWFFEQEIPGRHHWNQTVVLRPAERLDPTLLELAVAALVEHHDALRLSFRAGVAVHRSSDRTQVWFRDIRDASELARVGTEAQQSLDLENGPLLRALLVNLEDGSQRLVLAIHHLVVDGVSWRVLLEDLQRAYRQGQLPAKTSAYKRWAERLQQFAQSDALASEVDFWNAQLEHEVAALPCDRPQGGLRQRHARTVYTRLSSDVMKQLLQQAPAAYRTQINDLLLTALSRVIGRWTGHASTLLRLEGHGREELFDDIDLSRTVGWFTTRFPVKLTPAEDLGASIKAVKEQLRAVPNKGIGFGLLEANLLRGLAEPKITFNYLGQFDFDREEGLFTPTDEFAGPEQSLDAPLANELSIDGQVYGGELRLGWTFSGARFDDATMARLADEYRRELEAVVAHCCEAAHGGVTPSDFPLANVTQAELDALTVPAQQVEDLYPLSPMQQGLLFHTLYEQASGDYINQLRVDVDGLDPERFRSAWQAAVDAHDILRTGILWQGEFSQPVQFVQRRADVPFTQHDWRTQSELTESLDALAEGERQQGFDLARAPLFRLVLVRTGEGRHHLIYTCHHILMDGWSNAQLLGEVLSRYAGRPQVETVGRYRDYIGWLQRQDAAASETFWKSELADLETPTRLATASSGETGHAQHQQLLNDRETRRLSDFAREQKVTVNTLVQAAWLLLQQRYTGQQAVAIGATVSGRPAELQGIEQQIGLFINTLPLVSSPRPEERVGEWLQALQAKNVQLREHEYTPLYEIQRWASHGGDALFDTLLVFENFPVSEALKKGPTGELRFSGVENLEQTNYPLAVAVRFGETLSLQYDYSRAHFSAKHIQRLAGHFRHLLEGMLAGPEQRLGELSLLTELELREQLVAWNATQSSYAADRCIHELIEAQAAKTPNVVAVIAGEEELTYRELNTRANRLAHKLIGLGVGPEIRVGIAVERNLEMVVGLLGILKAGGAYVPLDPDYPAARFHYMLEDSGVGLLLTQSQLETQLAIPSNLEVLRLDQASAYGRKSSNPTDRVNAENLAYVIYTSGSTGKPKGVAIAHRQVAALVHWSQGVYSREDLDGVLASTSICFDLSVWELFVTLASGGSVIVARNALALPDLPARDRVRVINTVPSAIAALESSDAIPASVRIVNLAGEPLKQSLVDALYARETLERVYDLYGPSEDTTYSTYTLREVNGSANIGRPIANTSSYLLDGQFQPVPIGTAAELHLGGEGITRGYLHRAALTAERFIPNPYSNDGGRLYRTGDLARYRVDGGLEYVGRIDHQVKVRGFRIELGEIEARLQGSEQVREAVVVAQDGPSGKLLVGYVVPRDAEAPHADLREALTAQLKVALPDYMVPAHLVLLEKLPLTPNGKLDRKALPKPDASALQKAYVEPRTVLQKQIAAIWADVLKLERVGLEDNFIELGGDSIVSIQVVSRARQVGIRFTPKDLFQQQTLESLAAVATVGDDAVAIDQGPVEGELSLSPSQRAFFAEEIPERQHWNQSVVLRPMQRIDAKRLERAVATVVSHHDALRLNFSAGVAVHRTIAESRALTQVWVRDILDASELAREGTEVQQSLDLERGPLLRVLLANLADGSQRVVLAIHQLVVDDRSWRVLLEDLQRAYRQQRLPAKTSAYRLWTAKLKVSEAPLEQEVATLPCDDPHGRRENRHARTVFTKLSSDATQQLVQRAGAAYRTQTEDLLLTALARVIGRWTARTSTLLQLERDSREAFDDLDLSRTVGWFTTAVPVKLTPATGIGASIKAVKEQLRAVSNQAALASPQISFSYLDDDIDAEDGLFERSDEFAGADQSPDARLASELDLTARLRGGELSLAWKFSGKRFKDGTIQRLADEYRTELETLIAHCCDAVHGGVTPSDFPLANVTQAELDALVIPVTQIEDLYPLSPMQQGMLFHTLYDRDSGDYINQLRADVDGVDAQRFHSAWQAAADAHDILRTGFLWQGELSKPAQVVYRRAEVPFTQHDWRTQPELAAALDALAEGERQQGFDLSRAPLMRLVLVRTGENRHHLIYTSHHILMDGWSDAQLLGEVLSRYAAEPQPTSIGRYRDYIGWLQQQDAAASETFWKSELADLETPTRLATVLNAGVRSGEAGHEEYHQRLNVRETRRLSDYARQQKVTVNTVVQAAWLLLQQRYTGQQAVAIGATVSGRPAELQGIEHQLGLFINTLPVVSNPRPEQRVSEWLQALQVKNAQLREHEYTPLNEIQRWAGQVGEALFDTLLVFENFPVSEALQKVPSGKLRFGSVASRTQTNYPLTVGVNLGDVLSLQYDYSRAHFSAEQIERLTAHFFNLLDAIVSDPAKRIGELSLLGDAELRQQLVQWNATNKQYEYAAERCVHQRVEAQAERRPDAPALILGDDQLSYRELNEKANRLAQRLIELGVGPEVRVGVATERSLETIVGFLATLKAGGAYVPLDPEYPADRLSYMLEDSGVALLLTQSFVQPKLPIPDGLPVLCLDRGEAYSENSAQPPLRVHPENLAYVIYTSGSTGKPKGVVVSHGPLAMHIEALADCYATSETDCELQFMSFAFDGAHEHWLKALTRGARMVLRGPDLWTPDEMYTAMHQYRATVTVLPPVYLLQLAQYAESAGNPPRMRIYCFGGDAVPDASFELAKRTLKPEHIINGYGPTETVVTPLLWKADRQMSCGATYAPIGTRVGDRSAYVLDSNLELLPVGLPGELYLGGYGVARGYHNRASLTAERFVPDPFSETGGRLYRSGDLTRFRPDGVVDYVGRVDYQVKIRGFRIELGEIEAQLQDRDEVSDAVVVAHDGPGGKQLVGYVVPRDAGGDEAGLREQLRAALKAVLPDYMVPAHLMVLEQLPVTPNGKLDRKALPKPDTSALQKAYVEPRTELQKQIASIWAEILRLPRVGLTDNFFELGGDSIISIQVVSRARQAGIRFSPKDLFQHPTVQGLATVSEVGGEGFVIDQSPVEGELPLLPIQRWFFEQEVPERHHWNQSLVLRPVQQLEADILERAVSALVAHHDALRLQFHAGDAGWTAVHGGVGSTQVWTENIKDTSELERVGTRAQQSLDLGKSPLRVVLVNLSHGSQRLLLAIHHLVVDGVSWRVLLEDLQTAYRQLESGRAIQLPAKTSAYKTWAEKLERYSHSPELLAEADYWRAQETSATLPGLRAEGSPTNQYAKSVQTQLSADLTKKLLQQAPSAYRTQINDLLLTALTRVISRWTQQSTVLIQLEGHGREELFEDVDLSRTVGWLTSMFPVKLTATSEIGESIKTVKEQLRAVPNKGIGFGVLRAYGDDATRATLHALPTPKITFNYLGQFDGNFDIAEGLFVPTGESAGPDQSACAPLGNELSLNGQVYGGALSLSWSFSGERFDEATIQSLADEYGRELETLIAHCCDAAHGGATPSDFPLVKVTQAQLDSLAVPAMQIEDLYPLSPMQQGMLFHTLLEPRSGIYYMQDRYLIQNEIDLAKFEAAWSSVVQRHDALRVSFSLGQEGHMLQVVHRDWAPPLHFLDWSDRPSNEQESALEMLLAEDRERGFDLLRTPPMSLRLFRLAPARYCFVMAYHHILVDAWCRSLVYQDFFAIYEGHTLPAAGRYRDFIAWLQAQGESAASEAWRAELQDFTEVTPLPFDRAVQRQKGTSLIGDRIVALAAREGRGLSELAQSHQLTVNTFAQAAWALVLHRFSGLHDVLFGVTVAGRPTSRPEMQETVGLFINSIPLRVPVPAPDAALSVKDWLREILAHNFAMREHEHLPLVQIQAVSPIEKGMPLFDSLVVYESVPLNVELLENAEQVGANMAGSRTHTNYPITVVLYPGDELALHLSYDQRFFDEPTIDRMLAEYKRLLLALHDGFHGAVSELPLAAADEYKTLRRLPAVTRREYPLDAGYAALFERQVDAGPERVAASCLDEAWTYRALEARANRVGHALVEAGVTEDQPVALLAERSLALLGMMIGSFKAGAGYLALDPELPDGRLVEVLTSARPAALVILHAHVAKASALLAQLPETCRPQLQVWEDIQTDRYSDGRLGIYTGAHHLAYVIYTSGSTGRPKGALVEQAGMLNNQLSKIPFLQLSERDVIAQTASQSFDISVWQFLTAALCGARVDIVPNAIAHDPAALLRHVSGRGITVLESVPSLIQGFLDEAEVSLAQLRWMLPTGEAMSPELARRWMVRYPEIGLVNAYGPAECSDDVALYRVKEVPADGAWLPIGTATDNNQLYVLHADLQPVPVGAVGELYVSGTGVGRGYLNDRVRTAEVFFPNPFSDAGDRLYRTGDLARCRKDGVLEYVGRTDHQVKVRGFRIELGEIEARLAELEQVREAVVLAHDGLAGKQLVGYMVPRDASVNEVSLRDQLRTALKATLPDYMVPAHLLVLDALPLTPNGKVDRKALPKPDASALQKLYVEPQTELEKRIASIWAEVLKLDRVGLTDSFFELGGHSLLATQVVSRVKHQLGLEVSLRSMFEAQDLGAFASTVQASRRSDEPALVPAERVGPQPLSYAQQRQWFLWQLEPESTAYHLPVALRLKGKLDTAALQRAFNVLVERHESLRTTITQVGDHALQVIHPAGSVNVERVELKLDAQGLPSWVAEEINRPFDMETGPLLRVKLLRESSESHVLVIVMHHIVSDAWSMQVMVDELVALYEGATLPALPIQYADYAVWQRSWMEAGERERQLTYWVEQLGGEQPLLELPLDRARPSVQSYRGAALELPLSRELSSGLSQLAQREGATVFMVLLASFQALLHRYSGQNDIRVGVPVANRNRIETERLIGFFVNTQVLKAEVDSQTQFRALLSQVKQTVLDAQAHQDLPFEQLVEALQPERSLSHSPLFQVMVNHQSAGRELEAHGLRIESLTWDERTAQFDLMLDTYESAEGISASFTYVTDLFDQLTIQRLAKHWQNLLEGIVAEPRQRVGDLPLQSEAELEQQLVDWNRRDYPLHAGYASLFERQVDLEPNRVAASCEDEAWTYDTLDKRANRTAHALLRAGAATDEPIALLGERGLPLLGMIVGSFKAGAGYLALDPDLPDARILEVLESSRPRVLLTLRAHAARANALCAQLSELSSVLVWEDVQTGRYSQARPRIDIGSGHLAYVIYTSGSTGKPKGVVVEQAGMLNNQLSKIPYLQLTERDVIAQTASQSFDISVWQFLTAALCGARVEIVPNAIAHDPGALLRQVRDRGITVLESVPSLIQGFLEEAEVPLPQLRWLLPTGEAMPPELARRWLQRYPEIGMVNAYGPAECSDDVALYRVEQAVAAGAWLPIGTATDNNQLYVLHADLQPVPVGAVGELYVSGTGVGRGYLNDRIRTADAFLPNPFSDAGDRLYRTGDLARRRSDGVLEFVGRVDHQVKIRGFRIELGEIEARLLERDDVREAVVIAHEGPTGKQLVSYVVPREIEVDELTLRDQLRAALKATLPDYMVPSYLMVLEKLPLTPNGKIDRKALPKPDASILQKAYVEPRTDLEKQSASIWAEVLKLERIGLTDNFFELGGHSLLATQVVSRVKQQLGFEVSLRSVFESETLSAFATAVQQSRRSNEPPLVPTDRVGPLPLSYAQQRQWFLWQLAPESAAYHIPVALRLQGELDRDALQRAISALVARHESLRTTIHSDVDHPLQVIHPTGSVTVDAVELKLDTQGLAAWVEEEISRPFDLENGPLLRLKLLRESADSHVLVMVMHHIVSDEWSMQLMVEELVALYEGYRRAEAVSLPALPIQYADYATWQRTWMDAGERDRQLSYWVQQLGGEQPVLQLPLDRARPATQSHRGATLELPLSCALSSGLVQLAQREGATVFMVLLASFQALLHRYSGQNDIRVGVPVANRNRVETERLIGFFVNTQVLKAEVEGQASFQALLARAKQTVLDAQAHQDLPFEQLVEALQPERSLSVNPLFQVMLNHLSEGRDSTKIELPNLRIESLASDGRTAQFDLTLDTYEWTDGIYAAFTYATDLFDAATIERLARHWENLLEAIIATPQQPIAALPMLDEAELQQQLVAWNRNEADYPLEQSVHAFIEAQAAKSPDVVALVSGDEQLTYRELNEKANRLAHTLMGRGVGPEIRVGIAVERDLEMVVGLLAILKAGGAYVPLDPEYPESRIRYMLEDSGVGLLITQSHLKALLEVPSNLEVISLDEASAYSQKSNNPVSRVDSQNLAYVIYTSGSTGKPKGVAIAHRQVAALVQWSQGVYSREDLDGVLASTSICFDLSVWELFVTLASGGTVIIAANALALPELPARDRVRLINTVPSAISALLESGSIPPSVRIINLAGEPLKQSLVDALYSQESVERVYDLYGPSEDTTYSTYTLREGNGRANIGRPISNTASYLLDSQFQPVPIGTAAELHLGGAGITRGYLHRAALTAERFIPNPYCNDGGRLYRTGDLARYRTDGVLEYAGRIDHQVKVRGFRIELGEIEARLQASEQLREAVVVAQDGPSGQQLVGYVVPRDANAEASALRDVLTAQLKAALPDYMVPAHLLVLEKLPLTPNGKLDRKALPQPDASALQKAYIEPRTDLEKQIASIWAEVLKLDRVGLMDNFFELGGHSLMATQVVSRMKERSISNVPIRLLFSTENLAEFAEGVQAASSNLRALESEIAKSLGDLERLSPDELEKLIA